MYSKSILEFGDATHVRHLKAYNRGTSAVPAGAPERLRHIPRRHDADLAQGKVVGLAPEGPFAFDRRRLDAQQAPAGRYRGRGGRPSVRGGPST